MMNSDDRLRRSLPPDAINAVWRIFGESESPKKHISVHELVKPMVDKYVSSSDSSYIVDEIRSWFDSYGNRTWLKSEVSESVAALIVEGIGTDRSATAIWAIGSISADLAARIISSGWPKEQIDLFVEGIFAELHGLCDNDDVLDVSRCTRFTSFSSLDPRHTRIPKDALIRKGRLETYQDLNKYSFELVHSGLYHAVGNLIDLLIELRPDRFRSLIRELDHPVVHARAANRMTVKRVRLDHRASIEWITRDSSNAEVSLAIVHTLSTVNGLDRDIRAVTRTDAEFHHWSTELRMPEDDLDSAAADLLAGLVGRLATLEPVTCAGWVGELLSRAPYILDRDRRNEIPLRIKQLEENCNCALARLVRESWSDELLASLCGGLRMTPRDTWTRHLAEVAWEVRDESPERAAELAQATLKEDQSFIATGMEAGHLYLDGSDWHSQEWIQCLGIALALSQDRLDLVQWVSDRCRTLPLSVWDAEERLEVFSQADKAAQHWLVVALLAVPALLDHGRSVDHDTVLKIAQMVFAHCQFTSCYVFDSADASAAVECAARCAVEYGEPSEVWLLEQARNRGVGPRVLWALIDHGTNAGRSRSHIGAPLSGEFCEEYAIVSSERFHNGDYADIESLRFWGQLWFSLERVDEAEHTARELIRIVQRNHDDRYRIQILKLLALVHSSRRLEADLAQLFNSLYRQLWPGHMPPDEQGDRKEIDDLLERSQFSMFLRRKSPEGRSIPHGRVAE